MDSGVTAEHLPLIIIIFFYCSFDLNFFCVLVRAVLLLSYCIFLFQEWTNKDYCCNYTNKPDKIQRFGHGLFFILRTVLWISSMLIIADYHCPPGKRGPWRMDVNRQRWMPTSYKAQHILQNNIQLIQTSHLHQRFRTSCVFHLCSGKNPTGKHDFDSRHFQPTLWCHRTVDDHLFPYE